MKLCAGALILLLGSSAVAANVVAPTKSELEAMYGVAARELNAGHLREALHQLDAIDARQPDMAAAKNLRGAALMRMSEYGTAEKALQKARELDPGLWEARFNLAEIAFLRKSWAEARHRFEALAEEKSEQVEGTTGDLIQFKILLTYLIEDKEKKAVEILDRLKVSTKSPAYYCGKAAIAFRHRDETEARVNLKAAEKSFSPRLYQLFVESFYEVGWLKKPDGAVPGALEIASRADLVVQAQDLFAKAEQAYRQRDYAGALEVLDDVESAAPNQAVAHNLRGKILLAQGNDGAAETALREALVADPQFLEARYNLALIPFKKRDYEAARKQLEAILGATSGGRQQRQREQLIRYQIFLTLLLEGRDAPAQKAMEEFKMMDDSPSLYYAQAAWAFEHGNPALGNTWVANAGNLYPEEQARAFVEPFAELGWMKQSGAPAIEMPLPPLKPASTPVAPSAESLATVTTQTTEPKASPTPEATATSEKIASERKSVRSEDSVDRAKKKRKSTGGSARSKSKSARTEAAKPSASPPALPPSPATSEVAERPRRTFGDKVARFFLYPFQHRNQPPSPPVAPSESASPVPTRAKN